MHKLAAKMEDEEVSTIAQLYNHHHIVQPCRVCPSPSKNHSIIWITLEDLKGSAAGGECLRCIQVCEGLGLIGDDPFLKMLGFDDIILEAIICDPSNTYQFYVYPKNPNDDRMGHAAYELAASPSPRQEKMLDRKRLQCLSHKRYSQPLPLLHRERISGDLASEQAIQWASMALQACTQTHRICSDDTKWRRPARVLDLHWKKDEIRLYDFESGTDRYACLSHCWGARHEVQTRRSNLELHKEGILTNTLSKTFRDVIKFVSHLGIQFLWIDSLCIVQDDENDRSREMAAMCDIYRGCWICVAATAARDGSDGLFATVPPEFRGADLENDHADEGVHFFRKIPHWPSLVPNKEETLRLWPLLTRAWVFQERRLAPRVLHFTSHELIWECSVNTKCECAFFNMTGHAWKATLAHESAQRSLSVRFWHTQVAQYTTLNLSRPGDKLPAIGGLAKDASFLRTGRYLAGLWEDSLVQDLSWRAIWTPRPSVDVAPKPSTWRAPSWSWASIDTQVGFSSNFKPRCTVISVDCTGKGTNPFGEVLSGTLTLHGLTMEVYLGFDEGGFDSYSQKSKEEMGLIWTDSNRFGRPIRWDYWPNEEFLCQVRSTTKVLCFLLGEPEVGCPSILLKRMNGNTDTYERFAFGEDWDWCWWHGNEFVERTITMV